MDYTSEAQIQKQVRALVTAIRPSIIWSIDGITQPMDLLDDDGITGWQVGLGSIRSQLDGSDQRCHLALLNWIKSEQELEKSRWKNPITVLAQTRAVLGSKTWQLSHDQALLDQWLQNIEAAFARSPASQHMPLRSTQRYAAQVLGLLQNEAAATEVRNRLCTIVKLEPMRDEIAPINEAPRLVSRSDLRMLDRFLCISPQGLSSQAGVAAG